MRVSAADLSEVVAFLLNAAGCSLDIASEVADCLVEADMLGHHSHGVRMLASYAGRVRTGVVSGTARPQLISVNGPVARIDGKRAFGQIAGVYGAFQGVQLAKQYGVGLVTITGSSHFGRNGKWPEVAAAEGVVSLHFVSAPDSSSSIVPFSGLDPRLGSNPMAFGAPGPDGEHVILDFAVGEIAANAIRHAFETGSRLAKKAVLTGTGALSDDPAEFVNAKQPAMLAFGDYKGYGLTIFNEILAGAVGLGRTHRGKSDAVLNNNMLSIYIDATVIQSGETYFKELGHLAASVRSSRPVNADAPVTMPGDRARQLKALHVGEGLDVGPELVAMIAGVADMAGVAPDMRTRWPHLFQDTDRGGEIQAAEQAFAGAQNTRQGP